MIAASDVSAVLLTRGDVDMAPIIESLARFGEIIVWDNSQRENLAVYGRYAAIAECEHDLIYVQDDDCILEDPGALLRAHEPRHVVCNMPERFRHDFYEDHALVGFGALFARDLPGRAFSRAFGPFGEPMDDDWTAWQPFTPINEAFGRTCDVVFTALTPRILVDVPYVEREFAQAPNRMYRQPGHVEERARMLELARQARDA